MAESALGRELGGDEVVLVGRMVEAGKDAADILEVLDKPAAPMPKGEEDGGRTYRFEARGDKVVRIPDE